MKRVALYDIKRSRKGITTVELVVALAVIAAASVAVLSMMILSSQNEAKLMRKTEIVNYAENAVECFRYVIDREATEDPREELINLLNRTTEDLYKDDETDANKIILKGSSYTITITADFINRYIEFCAVDGNDPNEAIYSLTYTYRKE